MNISYTRVGDYLLPDLILKEGKQYSIEKYGLLKLRYLKEYNKGLYLHKFSINFNIKSF